MESIDTMLASCRRKYVRRCRRDGVDPELPRRIVAGERYLVSNGMAIREFQHQGHNQLRRVTIPRWMEAALV